MNKSNKLLYCILGSIILTLSNISFFYDSLNYLPVFGMYLSEATYFVSLIGGVLTIWFAILLIKENYK